MTQWAWSPRWQVIKARDPKITTVSERSWWSRLRDSDIMTQWTDSVGSRGSQSVGKVQRWWQTLGSHYWRLTTIDPEVTTEYERSWDDDCLRVLEIVADPEVCRDDHTAWEIQRWYESERWGIQWWRQRSRAESWWWATDPDAVTKFEIQIWWQWLFRDDDSARTQRWSGSLRSGSWHNLRNSEMATEIQRFWHGTRHPY